MEAPSNDFLDSKSLIYSGGSFTGANVPPSLPFSAVCDPGSQFSHIDQKMSENLFPQHCTDEASPASKKWLFDIGGAHAACPLTDVAVVSTALPISARELEKSDVRFWARNDSQQLTAV